MSEAFAVTDKRVKTFPENTAEQARLPARSIGLTPPPLAQRRGAAEPRQIQPSREYRPPPLEALFPRCFCGFA